MNVRSMLAVAAVALVCASGARAEEWRVPANFSGELPDVRAVLDIPFVNDMRLADGVSFDFEVGSLAEFSGFTCYFRSGEGWYRADFAPSPDGRRSRVRVDKRRIVVDGAPAGWAKVDLLRICGWRSGVKDTYFTVSNLAIDRREADILVVQAHGYAVEHPDEAGSCVEFADRFVESLGSLGIATALISDGELDSTALKGVRMVMLPFNPSLPPVAEEALVEFSARGGLVFAAYNATTSVRTLLGVGDAEWMSLPEGGRFDGFERCGEGLPGQPAFSPQRSWMTFRARPAADARVLATWRFDGSVTDIPAVVRNGRGVYFAHVWLGGTKGPQRALMKSVIADLMPDRKAAMDAADVAAEKRRLEEVKWVSEQPAGPADEFRAFWCHDPKGLPGRTWDESIGFLKEHGFNAIFVNLLWAATADYPTEVLKREIDLPGEYDAFAECQAACRRHGVAFHVWMVCWNLGWSTDARIVQDFAEEARLQRGADGKQGTWLCPSHPENLELEEEALVELAKKGPDGIHLDYIRYPDGGHCYCAGCRRRFEKSFKVTVSSWPDDVRRDRQLKAKWNAFRRGRIDELVRRVSRRVRAEAPGVKVSAAVFANFLTSRGSIAQDVRKWCEEGWLDFVCPMDYTDSAEMFAGYLELQKPLVGKVPMYPGIGLSSTGASSDGRCRRVAEQIGLVRQAGLKGFSVFNFDEAALEVLPILSQGPTRR